MASDSNCLICGGPVSHFTLQEDIDDKFRPDYK